MSEHCIDCPYKDRPTVPGRGPDKADIVVVGESPGPEEHKIGRILVGPSGQLLDAVLQRCDIDVDSIYRTNSSMCTPPAGVGQKGTEDIKKAVAYACGKDRREEILSRHPKVIIPMGQFGAQTMEWTLKGVTRHIGYTYLWNNIPTVINVHPAYMLRGGYDDFFGFQEVFKLARKIVDQPEKYPLSMEVPFRVAKTGDEVGAILEGLYQRVDNGEDISLDLETSGFDPHAIQIFHTNDGFSWRKHYILLIILGTERESILIRGDAYREAYEEIKTFLEHPKVRLGYHVVSFDGGWLRAQGITPPPFVWDSYLEHNSTDERKYTHGLKELAAIRGGSLDWESDIKRFLPSPKKSSYALIPPDNLDTYGSYDGVRTVQVHQEVQVDIGSDERDLLDNHLFPVQEMFLALRQRGMKIDVKRLREIDEAIQPRMEELEREAANIAKNPFFNLGSPVQCAKVIYDELGLKPILTTASGFHLGANKNAERSTDKDTLPTLPQVPFVVLLTEYRQHQYHRSHYTLGLVPFLDEYDRIHPQIDVAGTVTGRLASKDPSVLNVKQVERVKGGITEYNDIRSPFIPDDGYVIAEADESQFELRNYAIIAEIDEMLDVFARDEDIHQFTDDLLGLFDRMQAKGVNFGLVYGLTLKSFAARLGVVREMYGSNLEFAKAMKWAEELFHILMAKLPGIRKFEKREIDNLKRDGYLKTAFNRKRRFPLITDDAMWRIKNQGLNYRPSSTSSDLNLASMLELFPREEELGIQLFWPVHDSIVLQVIKGREDSLNEVGRVMSTTAYRRLGEPFTKVRYKVDIKTGKNWGHMNKWGSVMSW